MVIRSKNYILEWVCKNINVEKILSSFEKGNKDELKQTIFLILLEKDSKWLNERFNNNKMGQTIYIIARNLVYDKNSIYHKAIDRCNEYIDDVVDEEEGDYINIFGDIYNKEDVLTIFESILNEDEWLIELYKDYYIYGKKVKDLVKKYNLSRFHIVKRLVDVERYIKYEFIKKIKDLDYE